MKDEKTKSHAPGSPDVVPGPEVNALAEDVTREDSEVKKLAADLEDLRQTLVRHQADFANYRKGFELIYKQLLDNLARLGVERVEPLGQPFDPHLHQAMDRAETTEHADGTILEVYQPGYVYHGRVLRPAMVRVAVHPKAASNIVVN
jgi:molecular chaperone GrpE (heat shock protein)